MFKKKNYKFLITALILLLNVNYNSLALSQQKSVTEEIDEQLNNKGENSISVEIDETPNIQDLLRELFIESLLALAIVLIGLLTRYFTKKLDEANKKISIANEKVEGIEKPAKLEPHETINSVMVVGLGGSGKTSLIKVIVGDGNPEKRTGSYEIFSEQITMPADSPKKLCKIYISDYAGQSYLEGLIRGFIEQQKIPYSPMRYGYITSLILVVDLFAPPKNPIEEVSKSRDLDDDRINENIRMWNESSISAIFGMLTKNLKYICLFINKIDLYDAIIDKQEIKKVYEPIIDILAKRSLGIKIEVYIGSALNRNIGPIEEDLKNSSIDII